MRLLLVMLRKQKLPKLKETKNNINNNFAFILLLFKNDAAKLEGKERTYNYLL